MPMKKSGMWRNKNSSTSKKATPYRNKGVTEVGKEAKTQSYKEYVQKMFGGGMSGNRGFLTQSNLQSPDPRLPRGKVGRGPGMRAGGISSVPFMPSTGPKRKPGMPSRGPMLTKPKRPVRPDPRLPRGKKGKGDI
jgi:hypothetical protein|tara:strand:+ start:502 stop:906 length:405 start_codon:yes stop_codon:yes gene_type:complete